MLHGVITGPPGVGKSSAAKKIAKVFYAIGVIDEISNKLETKNIRLTSQFASFVYKPDAPLSPPVVNICSETMEPITHEAGEILTEINKFRVLTNEVAYKIKHDEEMFEEDASTLIQKSIDIAFKCTNIIHLCQSIKTVKEDSIPFGAATITMNPPILPEPKFVKSNNASMEKPFFNTKHVKKIDEKTFEEAVVVCGRSELVAEYSGQSTIKTKDFLMANRGKVVIIEEAYLLYTGDRDQFGMEALTELNRFMDEHANEIIIYMTGYSELMSETIFKAQPGLKRRCTQVFNIEGYTSKGLMEIFKQQITSKDWSLCSSIRLEAFFEENYKTFTYFGGDTFNLAYQCKQVYSDDKFKNLLSTMRENEEQKCSTTLIITEKILKLAMEAFKTNRVKELSELGGTPPEGMYN
jgi:SpoVK/Ycf46/Vps4 family AAA+-type ATPase